MLTHRWPRCARGPLLQGPRHGSGAPDRERSWGLAIQQPEKAQRFPRRAGATELQNKPGHRGQARGSRGQGARIAMRAAYSVGVVFIGGPSSCLALFAAASCVSTERSAMLRASRRCSVVAGSTGPCAGEARSTCFERCHTQRCRVDSLPGGGHTIFLGTECSLACAAAGPGPNPTENPCPSSDRNPPVRSTVELNQQAVTQLYGRHAYRFRMCRSRSCSSISQRFSLCFSRQRGRVSRQCCRST